MIALGQSDVLSDTGIWSEVSTRTDHGLNSFTLRGHLEDNLLFPATQILKTALLSP